MKKVLFIVFFVTIFISILVDSIALDRPNLKSLNRKIRQNALIGCVRDRAFGMYDRTRSYIADNYPTKRSDHIKGTAAKIFDRYWYELDKELQIYLDDVGDDQVVDSDEFKAVIRDRLMGIGAPDSGKERSDFRVLAGRVANGIIEFGTDNCPEFHPRRRRR